MSESPYSFTLSELSRLLEEISAYGNEPLEFVQNRYERYAGNFENALKFLTTLRLIKKTGGKLHVSPNLKKIEYPLTLGQIVKDTLLRSSEFPDVQNLILKFEPHDNFFEYAPTRSERFIESDVRNLLIKLDVIKYDHSQESYTIDPNSFEEVFSRQDDRDGHRKLSLAAFRSIEENRQLIGAKAEEAVLVYERERLASKTELIKSIIHIAEQDVSAGYDIESFESVNSKLQRFIEVKAVSPVDYGFEWSTNEINVSRKLKDLYHLYLVPVVNGLPNTSDLQIIKDPAEIIFGISEWVSSISGYSVTRVSVKNKLDQR